MNPTKRRLLTGLVLTLAGCALTFAPHAFADGKVFPPQAFPAEVRIPDQTALLCWSNGVERLVIETRFAGQGTNFAWVVPLPAVPTIEPATTGLFVTLRHQLQPEIIHNVRANWGFIVPLGALLWLVLTVRRGEPGLLGDTLACIIGGATLTAASGLWIFGFAIFGTFLVGAFQVRRRAQPISVILITGALILLIIGMLLPVLATAKAKGTSLSGSDGVEVLEQQRVGVYDTVTLSASDPQALPRWLDENGFALTPGSAPVIEAYARDGWVFVAAKARRTADSTGVSALHPLSFTFPAKAPVYPLRLTAVGNESVEVDLFVLGPECAAVNGFEVMECRRVDGSVPEGFLWRNGGDFRLGHPLLRQWGLGSAVVTRLQGTLDAAAMEQDAILEWEPFRGARTRFYSTHGALTKALNVGVPMLVCWLLVLPLRVRRSKRPLSAITRPAFAGMFVGLIVFLAVFFSLPRISVRVEHRLPFLAKHAFLEPALAANDEFTGKPSPTLHELRACLAKHLQDLAERGQRNHILGGLIRAEDSPGNYAVREADGYFELRGYDAVGGPWVVVRWTTNDFRIEPGERP